MKRDVIFVGNRLILNEAYERYILRNIKSKLASIDSISYFDESDKDLFLHLDGLLKHESKLIIITTKSTFTIVGKLLSTVTADNQVLKDNMLIPSRANILENGSYLLNHNSSEINVVLATEGKTLPPILIDDESRLATIHLFNEELLSAQTLLEPLAQNFDVRLEFSQLVEGWIKIRIHTRRHGNLSQFIASAKGLMHHKVISASNIAAFIIERLSHHKKKLSFAESCSGGSLAHFFTAHSGSSAIFDGSLITYSNTLKANWLAVEDESLEAFGAVSAEVVLEMSEGAMNVSYADFALAISGVAGPTGGSDAKPVGTVYISARSKTSVHTERFHFEGDRNYIQEQSVLMAVKMLLNIDRELFFT
ncbi:MAG: damage-inducible protein CinA [Sulfuricurvum sp. MLSB]|uniref:CinA family protein n=1 Tax=unclassified Sulfuricurvum TaxID=2632390 RepID=UPI0005003776|nr:MULTISPECIES: CinA family protein [unclassified Sulfuricurvum]KFN40147.1 MAG: damage-inducible protein CinA [Sulfuricurvum sp. MLSB]